MGTRRKSNSGMRARSLFAMITDENSQRNEMDTRLRNDAKRRGLSKRNIYLESEHLFQLYAGAAKVDPEQTRTMTGAEAWTLNRKFERDFITDKTPRLFHWFNVDRHNERVEELKKKGYAKHDPEFARALATRHFGPGARKLKPRGTHEK